MKLASVDSGTGPMIAVLDDGGQLIDLREVDDRLPSDMRALLDLGPEVLAAIPGKLAKATSRLDPDSVRFLPVVPQPQAIWCAALNYRLHIEEGAWETPARPPLFLRVPMSLCGHEQSIVKPVVSDRLDYEGELAVIIGTRARHVPEAAAYDVIAGYSCFNDGSVRDWQRHTKQITNGKNFAATGGFGPFLTTKDEVPDIEAAELTTMLNGKVMQRAKVSELIFGIPQLISYVSTICDLLPGDVIVTGTPGGVGGRQDPPVFLQDGDTVEVEVTGVGRLRNPVIAEDRRAVAEGLGREVTV
jgi:2-keto-4-pentenoate hydratase/2-oxohepta-3-ene-1,7-dioic acid hydratase in catechol pathway